MSDVVKEMDELLDDGMKISESGIELNLRKLNTGDIFRAARMVKRLGIKDDLKELVAKFSKSEDAVGYSQDEKSVIPVKKTETGTEEKSRMEIGIDFIFSLIEMITNENAESELYQFLSGPLGINEQQVEELEFERMAEALLKIADVDRWKYFLSQAAH